MLMGVKVRGSMLQNSINAWCGTVSAHDIPSVICRYLIHRPEEVQHPTQIRLAIPVPQEKFFQYIAAAKYAKQSGLLRARFGSCLANMTERSNP